MGFKRIQSVWVLSLLSTVVFVALAVGLAGPPTPLPVQAAAAAPSAQPSLDDGALIRSAAQTTDLPPLREYRVGNPDRRKVVMVPVTQAGALLMVEADFAQP